MSKLKINTDLFLGSQELNRWQKFLDDDGFRSLLLQNSISFGIVNNSKNGAWDNFLISQGTNIGTIKNNTGIAIDINGHIITRAAIDNIALTNDNNWYWIKIAHQYTSNELGLVSIDVSGNLTGVGTEFTKILRGSPNNPVKISFTNGVSNTQEYFVQSVISDTSAILSGVFAGESNLTYAVVGAFTPDIVVPSGSKYPYQYSNCLMTLVLESSVDTPPTLVTDVEFVVARVKRNGSTISIQDKRKLNIYRDKADYDNNVIPAAVNPLIGVTRIKNNTPSNPRNTNLVFIEWSFSSNNWTFNSSTNTVTLNGGQGGKYKDTSYFNNGDFDGWRLYGVGLYGIVRSSSKSGSQINLVMDSIDPDKLSDTAQRLNVTPNFDTIEITCRATDDNPLVWKKVSFPINIPALFEEGVILSETMIPLEAYGSSVSYYLYYNYYHRAQYAGGGLFPADPVGYYPESSYNDNGAFIGGSRVPYTTSITLTRSSNAYVNVINSLVTGDLFGVDYMGLNNASPVYDFVVGSKKQQQIITNGAPYTLTTAHYFNFKTTVPASLRNGNRFVLFFNNKYNQGNFSINLTQDYINSGSPGTVFYTFDVNDYSATSNNTLMLVVVFDGTNWAVERIQGIPNELLTLGSLDNAGDPGGPFTTQVKRLLSKLKTSDTSDFNLNAAFDAEQTAATSHSIQGLEGITTVSHPSGTVALALSLIGNFFLNSTGTVSSAFSVQGGGNTRLAGTINEWALFRAIMANSGGATIQDGIGFLAEVFPAGVMNKWNAKTLDRSGKQFWSGTQIEDPVDLGTVGTSQNDYAIGEGTSFKITPSAGINVTGIAGGVEGRRIELTNLSGSFGITFPDASGSSLAANRFAIPGSFTLAAGNTCQFRYISGAWRLTSKTN